MTSKKIYDRLGDFSCGQLAGAGSFYAWLLLDWRQRSVFRIPVVGLAGSGVGIGAALVAGSLEKFPNLFVLWFYAHFLYFHNYIGLRFSFIYLL